MAPPAAAAARRPDPGGAPPPVIPPAGPDPDRKLTLALPLSVLRELRARTAAEDTTVRALVLGALRAAGYAVPEAELRDRRRRPAAAGGNGRP